MDRIEAVEKAKALLGEMYEGIQVMTDCPKNGRETTDCTVFWRKRPDSMMSLISEGTLEEMIERLEESMGVSA